MTTSEAESLFYQAIAAHKQGDLSQAERLLTQALALHPRLFEALLALGNIHYERQEFETAESCYAKALAERPDKPEAIYNLANARLQLGRYQEAAAGFKEVISYQSDNSAAAINAAAAERRARDYQIHKRHAYLSTWVEPDTELNPRWYDGALGTYADCDEQFFKLYEQFSDLTMTSFERMYALYQAVLYIERAGIVGDIVECGVWRGGSALLAAGTLKLANSLSRFIYLFDTFKGMTEPGTEDSSKFHANGLHGIWSSLKQEGHNEWCYASRAEVEANIIESGLPLDRFQFVEGDVIQTLPTNAPEEIALLRLDTDWYDSTRCELEQLYPRLAKGGILIIDDYGHFDGARKAVDEYFSERNEPVFLQRIDFSGRLVIKQRAG